MTETPNPTRNNSAINPLDIHLRPAQAKDEAFLRSVHDAGRAWEFAPLKAQGEDELYATIMKQQYAAQHDQYFNTYTLAKYAVIEWCGQPIGRVYADFRDQEIRLMDLIILPAFRGKGIAEIIVSGLCRQAAQDRKPVTLSVHPANRARDLYARLGFREKPALVLNGEAQQPFIEMEWRDPETAPVSL